MHLHNPPNEHWSEKLHTSQRLHIPLAAQSSMWNTTSHKQSCHKVILTREDFSLLTTLDLS